MHPCLQCGACCAAFRVSFYWAEAEQNGLPGVLLEQVSPFLACMRGSQSASPRCVALEGDIGQQTRCRIYAQRPSACREVLPGDAQCNKARARHGLAPIAAESLHAPQDDRCSTPASAPDSTGFPKSEKPLR